MKKIIRIGSIVETAPGEEKKVTNINTYRYYLDGEREEFFTAGELQLKPEPPKEIKKTPLKNKSAGPLLQQTTETAPGQKPIQKKLHQIRQVSKKLSKDLVQYRKQATKYLETHTECAVKTKNCTVVAEEVHHKAGRGSQLLNEDKWLPICTSCHIWVTEHSREAIELGFSEKRNC